MKKKYFLGSVGDVEALRYNSKENRWEVAFRSKTLTDSGINISTTKDDIRAGTGAPIQFSFYHDPSAEITLTDVLFDQAYIEAQLGAEFKFKGEVYEDEMLKFESGEGGNVKELKYEAMPMAGSCKNDIVIRYTKKGENDWKTLAQGDLFTLGADNKTLTMNSEKVALEAGEYCFRYLRLDENAQIAKITSEIIPQELFLIIKAPVYAGDACSASNGKRAGTITYEIPRFRLNGSQDFAMNMSSNQTMSLSGVALAAEEECGTEGSNLIRIAVQYDDVKWYDDIESLVADEECLEVGKTPIVYGIHAKNNEPILLDNDDLEFKKSNVDNLDAQGKFKEAGETVITFKLKPEISETVTVAAAA